MKLSDIKIAGGRDGWRVQIGEDENAGVTVPTQADAHLVVRLMQRAYREGYYCATSAALDLVQEAATTRAGVGRSGGAS